MAMAMLHRHNFPVIMDSRTSTGESMQLTKLALGLGLALGITATAYAQTTMRISISVAQNSHQGVAIDTFAKEVE
jgi:hypothetical protein